MQNKNISAILLFISLFVVSTTMGQSQKDSFDGYKATPENFSRVMQMTNPSDAQFDSIWTLAKLYGRVSDDTFKVISAHAAAITKNSKNRALTGRGIYLKGLSLAKDSVGLGLLLEASSILKEVGDINYYSLTQTQLGTYYGNRNELETALKYNLNALNVLQPGKDSARMIAPLMAVGGMYFKMRELERAQIYLSQAIELVKALGEKDRLPPILANQAKLLCQLGDKHRAIADTMRTGAEVYQDSSKMYYRKGLDIANQGLALSQELKNGHGILGSLTSIMEIKNGLGEYKEAAEIGEEALQKAKTIGNPTFIMDCQRLLAASYRNVGDFKRALRLAQDGYDLSLKNNSPSSPVGFEKELYAIYKGMGRPAEALQMLEKVRAFEAKQHGSDTKKAITEAEAKYQTAEKEKKILKLEVAQEKTAKQRNYILLGVLFMGLFSFWRYPPSKGKKGTKRQNGVC